MDLNNKLNRIKAKTDNGEPLKIMIIGLGSVGLYLLDYLINLSDPSIHIIVAGRDLDKMTKDVNIVKTAATIRQQLFSRITIEGNCDLENVSSITEVLAKYSPDFIINSSRVYSGLKYGSISWHTLRAYGIWTPLSVKYAKNIMEGYDKSGCEAITINTSYSDAVIPWLKSAHKSFPDFGSGNLNHLIPRMKFYIADRCNIENLNEIDITLATSHFHDVVISKEGHAEGQELLLDIKYNNEPIALEQSEILKSCSIAMPVDQKRNMMNASSNFNILFSIIDSIKNNKISKFHSPGAQGEIGGYPYIINSTNSNITSYFDTSVFSMEDMRTANRNSIYLDGIEDVSEGFLCYTDELIDKVKKSFNVDLPKKVHYDEISEVGEFIINNIIKANL